MCGDRKVGKTGLTAAASLLTLALVALPAVPSLDGVSLDGTAAYAKGGNGGGNAGGKGGRGGKGGKGGASIVLLTDSHGKGHTGQGNGHSKDAVSGVHVSHNGSHPDNHGALASLLGRLNAAHASPNALANAAEHSAVGRLANYVAFLGAGDIDLATAELLAVANKDVADTGEATLVVREVNGLVGVTVGGGAEDTITSTEEGDLIQGFAEGDVGGGLGPAP